MRDTDTRSAASAVAVTPSDTTVLTRGCRALWIGGAGTVAVVMANDTAPVSLASVPAGTLMPVQAAKVMATNTTATLIVALY